MDRLNKHSDKLKQTLRDKLYHAEIEADDMSWQEIEPKLENNKKDKYPLSTASWYAIAASILIAALVFGLMIGEEEHKNGGLADQNAVQENNTAPQQQQEVLTDTKVPNIPKKPAVITKTEPAESIQASRDSFTDIAEVRTLELNTFLLNKNSEAAIGSGSFVTYTQKVETSDMHAFSRVSVERNHLGFNGISIGLSPLLQYNTLIPHTNDLILINNLQPSSGLGKSRLGFKIHASLEKEVSKRFTAYSGISYSYQHIQLEIETLRAISSIASQTSYNSEFHNLGIYSGLKITLLESRQVKHSFVIEGEFQKNIGFTELPQADRFTLSLGYEFGIPGSTGSDIYIQPVFTYSLKSIKSVAFDLQPYWLGIKFSISKPFR